MRLHIGHHFFGSGNLGDDLMLAGFLTAAKPPLAGATFTCSTPFDRESQQRRFPEIEWLAYDPAVRAAAIEACDAWLGVGDTPFQTDVGGWFLDHLMGDLDLCRRFKKQMFFVGVGLNNRAAISHPHTRDIVRQARHIWTRDSLTIRLLTEIRDPSGLSTGADLANVFLAQWKSPALERRTLALLLNFEQADAFTTDAICDIIERSSGDRPVWLFQEVRPLPGSERDILAQLPEACRARLQVREPDYARDSLGMLLARWGAPDGFITSRYHGALVGAWLGSRVGVIERNDKLTGLVEQLGLASAKDLRSVPTALHLIQGAMPVDRDVLESLAARAARSVEELSDALAAL